MGGFLAWVALLASSVILIDVSCSLHRFRIAATQRKIFITGQNQAETFGTARRPGLRCGRQGPSMGLDNTTSEPF